MVERNVVVACLLNRPADNLDLLASIVGLELTGSAVPLDGDVAVRLQKREALIQQAFALHLDNRREFHGYPPCLVA